MACEVKINWMYLLKWSGTMRGTALVNQHSEINRTHEILQDDKNAK